MKGTGEKRAMSIFDEIQVTPPSNREQAKV